VELLPLVILAGVFVVLVVLPMRNRSRQLAATRQMQAGLTVGAEVMTTSGLLARVAALTDDTVELEIAPGVVVRWARAAIAEIRGAPAGEPTTIEPTAEDGEPGPG
jgi:preprotein translocase subunit YajC